MSSSGHRENDCVSPQQIEQHFGPVCEWHVVDHFETIDEAAARVDDLLRDGHHARHAMIGGLSVVARRRDDAIL